MRTASEVYRSVTALEVPERLSRSAAKRYLYGQDSYFREGWRDFDRSWGAAAAERLDRLTFILFKPDGVVSRAIGRSLRYLRESGFLPVYLHRFRFDRLTIRELWRFDLNVASLQRLDAIDLLLTATDSVLIVLYDSKWTVERGASGSERLRDLKGPSALEERRSGDLRSVIASGGGLLNCIHAPDDTAQLVRELSLLVPVRIRRHISELTLPPGTALRISDIEAVAYEGTPRHDMDEAATIRRIREAAEAMEASIEREVILRAAEEAEASGKTDWEPCIAAMNRAKLSVEDWDKIVFAASCTVCNVENVEPLIEGLDQILQGGGSGSVGNPDGGFMARGDFVYREGSDVPVFRRGTGARLIDDRGRTYLDAEAANGSAGLGYDSSILRDAVRRLGDLPGLPSFLESEVRLRVAERVARRVNDATGTSGRVAFDLGGAQAIELALKVARRNRTGDAVVVFEGAYHGRTPYASQLSASARYREPLGRGERVVRLPYPNCERCRFGQVRSSCALQCVSYVEETFTSDYAGIAGSNGVSALVMEPILNVGGMVFPDPEYIEGVVRRMRAMGALVIVDEIFSGLFRTGPEWGFQHYDFTPDIVVFSKAFTNGIVPLSGLWARDPLLDEERFPPGTHSITFGNNPVCLAVVDVVLDRYDRMDARGTVRRLSGEISAALERLKSRFRSIGDVSVRGAAGRVRLVSGKAGEVRALARHIAEEDPVSGCHGLLVGSTGMADDTVCIYPPLTFTGEDVEALEHLLERTFERLEAADEMP